MVDDYFVDIKNTIKVLCLSSYELRLIRENIPPSMLNEPVKGVIWIFSYCSKHFPGKFINQKHLITIFPQLKISQIDYCISKARRFLEKNEGKTTRNKKAVGYRVALDNSDAFIECFKRMLNALNKGLKAHEINNNMIYDFEGLKKENINLFEAYEQILPIINKLAALKEEYFNIFASLSPKGQNLLREISEELQAWQTTSHQEIKESVNDAGESVGETQDYEDYEPEDIYP